MEDHARPPVVGVRTIERWRADMVEALRSQYRGARARRLVADFEKNLRWIAAQLHALHGTPHLGNLADPTDEFVFIVLSRKTAERAYLRAFEALRRAGPWEQVRRLGEGDIADLIHGGGLEEKKARAIVAGLTAIAERFGVADLARARDLDDQTLSSFLSGLSEVGPKSSRCVMLYSFGRAVFPVDAHVGRVLARLGCLRTIGIELLPMGHKERQRALEDAMPPDLRYGLHVNLVAHGRTVCRAAAPACEACVLASRCAYGTARLGPPLGRGRRG
ncbi:MAG: Endonuclease III [Thermoanaerobaculia bacterium]|nr:Endonuclease III [Thermoanaerobaculia bacterium]